MQMLNTDANFHFELLRALGVSRDRGADIAEVLDVAGKILPGDCESWYKQFNGLAGHVRASIDYESDRHPVSTRNAMFRAATYYRTADFFLHGNPRDPRIRETWKNATDCFDRAISLLDPPARRIHIEGESSHIPAILYRPSEDGRPRPTLLLFNGFDGSQEEMLHQVGFPALERGFNILTFECPGQPTVLREQGIGFIGSWLIYHIDQLKGPVKDKQTLIGSSTCDANAKLHIRRNMNISGSRMDVTSPGWDDDKHIYTGYIIVGEEKLLAKHS